MLITLISVIPYCHVGQIPFINELFKQLTANLLWCNPLDYQASNPGFCRVGRILNIWGQNSVFLRTRPFYCVVLWPHVAAVNIIPEISEIPGTPVNQIK